MRKRVLYGLTATAVAAIAAGLAVVPAASAWHHGRLEKLVAVEPQPRERALGEANPASLRGIDAADHIRKVRAFEALKQRAIAGEAVAQRLLADTYDACSAVNRDRASFIANHEYMIVQMDEAEARIYTALTRRHFADCDAVDGGAPVSMDGIRAWRTKAAQNGDMAARSWDYIYKKEDLSADEAARHLEEVVASHDPAAVFAYGTTMGGIVSLNMEAPYAAVTDAPWSGSAWVIAACRMGYDCGPESDVMVDRCVTGMSCEGLDYEQATRASLDSDAEREALDKNVQAVLTMIET